MLNRLHLFLLPVLTLQLTAFINPVDETQPRSIKALLEDLCLQLDPLHKSQVFSEGGAP